MFHSLQTVQFIHSRGLPIINLLQQRDCYTLNIKTFLVQDFGEFEPRDKCLGLYPCQWAVNGCFAMEALQNKERTSRIVL